MNALCDQGSIVENERAKDLFGFEIDASTNFKKLLRQWQEDSPGAKAQWFESLAYQIAFGISKQYPRAIPWAPYISESGKSTIPYVARSRQTAADRMQFDTYFIPVVPTPLKAMQRMIPTSEAFHIRVDQKAPTQIRLGKLIDDMYGDERTWLPILGEGRKAL